MAYYPVDWFMNLIEAAPTVLFSTNAGLPGAVFVSLIRLDTTNKHCYVWDGTQYVKISDYA